MQDLINSANDYRLTSAENYKNFDYNTAMQAEKNNQEILNREALRQVQAYLNPNSSIDEQKKRFNQLLIKGDANKNADGYQGLWAKENYIGTNPFQINEDFAKNWIKFTDEGLQNYATLDQGDALSMNNINLGTLNQYNQLANFLGLNTYAPAKTQANLGGVGYDNAGLLKAESDAINKMNAMKLENDRQHNSGGSKSSFLGIDTGTDWELNWNMADLEKRTKAINELLSNIGVSNLNGGEYFYHTGGGSWSPEFTGYTWTNPKDVVWK